MGVVYLVEWKFPFKEQKKTYLVKELSKQCTREVTDKHNINIWRT